MKKCSSCFTDKPIIEFYVASKSKDGRQSMCIPCYQDYFKRWRENRKSMAGIQPAQSKVCYRCHVEKPISQFGTLSVAIDKKMIICKPCWRMDVKKAKARTKVK